VPSEKIAETRESKSQEAPLGSMQEESEYFLKKRGPKSSVG